MTAYNSGHQSVLMQFTHAASGWKLNNAADNAIEVLLKNPSLVPGSTSAAPCSRAVLPSSIVTFGIPPKKWTGYLGC